MGSYYLFLTNKSLSITDKLVSLPNLAEEEKRGVFNEEGRKKRQSRAGWIGGVELVGEDWGLFNIWDPLF